MSVLVVVVPVEIEVAFAIFNIVLSGWCLVMRIHHQQKYPSKLKRVMFLGLVSIIFAFILSWSLLNTVSFWFFGDVYRWCDLGLKVGSLMYVLHRYFLYAFIVWRIEVVNRNKLIPVKIIILSKGAVIVLGIVAIVCAIIFPKGVEDENWPCNFEMEYMLLALLFVIDMLMCLCASLMFIWPVYTILLKTDDLVLRKTMRKERLWMGITILSTVVTLLTIVIVDGSGAVIGFDCSVTSLCLVVLMSPVKRRGGWRPSADTDWSVSGSKQKSSTTGGSSTPIFVNSGSNKVYKYLNTPFCCLKKRIKFENTLELELEIKSADNRDEQDTYSSELDAKANQSSLILDAEIDILLSQPSSDFLVTPKELPDSTGSQLTVPSRVSQGQGILVTRSIDSESISAVEQNPQIKKPTAIQLEFVNTN